MRIDDGNAARSQPHLRFKYLWLVLCGFFMLASILSQALLVKSAFIEQAPVADIGASWIRSENTGQRYDIIRTLRPESPLARLGLREGDHIRFDRPWDDLRRIPAGETLGLTRLSPGQPVVHLTTMPLPAEEGTTPFTFNNLLSTISSQILLLMGIYILWRSRLDPGLMALGMAFVTYNGAATMAWPMPASSFPAWTAVIFTGLTLSPPLFLRFSMLYYAQKAGGLPVWSNSLFWVLTSVLLILHGFDIASFLMFEGFPYTGFVNPLNQGLQIVCYLCSLYFLVKGWHRSAMEDRQRYGLMLLALPLTFIPNIADMLMFFLSRFHYDINSPYIISASISRLTGTALFTYAIFRHKVLDLSFAINRVLVYGVVSAILLVAFGFFEWLFEHFIPIESREKSALVDAAIAVAVFLAFHRVRDFVEHHIEALFFRSWHRNEAALKRFVKEASYIGKPDALVRAFVMELARFGGGAKCVCYLSGPNGYRITAGVFIEAAPVIDSDDPALVALRAHREAIETDPARSRLPAALALPMIYRDALTGLALLGHKPNGESYRPDEIEILSWATHQISQDIQALRVEQLEHQAAEHRQQIACLDAQLQVALKTFPGTSPAPQPI